MAIQFHCPYCTASIRVPDTAAGKQGTCPKCETKLIVPKVGPPPAASAPRQKPPIPKASAAASPAEAALKGTQPPPIPKEDAPEIPAFPIESSIGSPETSMARVVRQRAKRKGSNPLIPIALFSVVVGVIGYWMWQPEARLEGQLTAERLENFEIPPATIEKAAFGLSADETETMLKEMQQDPPNGVRVPDWFLLEFQPIEEGLKVVIEKTSATEVFRIDMQKAPALRKLIREHGEAILNRQQEEYDAAAKKLAAAWKKSREDGLLLDMGGYRNSLGFNRLTDITGYALAAEVDGRSYRCVHEDKDGKLYFLLPSKTETFLLKGRKFEDGVTLIPGSFTVEVQNSASEQPAEEPPAETPEPAEPEPATEPTMDAPAAKTPTETPSGN